MTSSHFDEGLRIQIYIIFHFEKEFLTADDKPMTWQPGSSPDSGRGNPRNRSQHISWILLIQSYLMTWDIFTFLPVAGVYFEARSEFCEWWFMLLLTNPQVRSGEDQTHATLYTKHQPRVYLYFCWITIWYWSHYPQYLPPSKYIYYGREPSAHMCLVLPIPPAPAWNITNQRYGRQQSDRVTGNV